MSNEQRYKIKLAPRALRDLCGLARPVLVRIRKAIDDLQVEPRPHGVKKLKAEEGFYRVREGDFRIIYQITDAELIVLVVAIGDRKEIYRRGLDK